MTSPLVYEGRRPGGHQMTSHVVFELRRPCMTPSDLSCGTGGQDASVSLILSISAPTYDIATKIIWA